jgi:A/G-specific adenine glycosylase
VRVWSDDLNRKFRRLILPWYATHRRELPWRSNTTAYRVWISEVMLQQTQVRTVLRYYERFLRRFPGPEQLAAASEEELLSLWSGLGYYRRARNLRLAARVIVNEFSGRFPDSFEDMILLPGIGRYTACAIESIAFNRPRPVVDGNVRRVMIRLHGLEGNVAESFFWKQASAWVPPDRPGDFNQAVMELGALVCVPGRPRCNVCPVRGMCRARKDESQDRLPHVRQRRAAERVELAAVVVACSGRILLIRQPEAFYIPGVWGIPTRIIVQPQDPDAVARLLSRRLTGTRLALERITAVRHGIMQRRITAHVFSGLLQAPTPPVNGRWVGRQEFDRLVTSSLFHKILARWQNSGVEDLQG